MRKILHLSWEVPDQFNRKKTKAVLNLLEETKSFFETLTFSFNRNSRPGKISFYTDNKNHIAVKYFGLPFGLFHLASLKNLYTSVCQSFEQYELLHGHKITFEGVLCYLAHKQNGKRYVLTLRGDTDFKFIHCLPQYRKLFQKVAEQAEKIFCLNLWSAEKLKKIYPATSSKIVILPNICYIEKFIKIENEKTAEKDKKLRIVTTFNLDVYKRKRFELALRVLKGLPFPASLLVIGSGSPAAEESVKKLIRKYSLQDKVELLGYRNSQEIMNIYSGCDLFLLPSKRETFGMAILEALCSGLPVLQTEGAGLDGYFSRKLFFMTARSEEGFVAAIEEFCPKKNEVKADLLEFLKSGHAENFSVKNIVNTYVSEINSVFLN